MSVTIVDEKTGEEKQLETVPNYESEPAEVSKDSGMYESMKYFMEDNKNGKKEDSPALEDKEKGEGEKEEDKNLSGENKKEGGDKEEEGIDNKNDLENKGENKQESTDISVIKQEFETKENDYKTKITNLENELTQLKNDKSQIPADVQAFFDELKGDFSGAWNKYKGKLGLPDFGLIQTQFAGGGQAARLKQHIESVVKPQIEKEFGLEAGKFKYDHSEAESDPTSASARFLELKRSKEVELQNETKNLQEKEIKIQSLVKQQQEADIKYIADTHFGGDLAKAKGIIAEMNQMAIKAISGQAKPEEHPFSVRHVIRGYKFDHFLNEAVERTKTDLIKQIRDLGIVLPDKEFPTNLNGTKGAPPKEESKPFQIQKSEFSPMLQSIESDLS